MNITFDKDELRDFMGKFRQWYGERDHYAVSHWREVPFMDSRDMAKELVRLHSEFAEKNPQPDWRALL